MKIKKLHIKNFKSIADLEIIEPNPFTVFVGPNGSGKSNIFEALEFWNLGNKGYTFDLNRLFGGEDNIVHFNYENSENFVEMFFKHSNIISSKKTIGHKIKNEPSRFYTNSGFGNSSYPFEQTIEKKQFIDSFSRIFVNTPKGNKLNFQDSIRLTFISDNLEKVLKRILKDVIRKEEILDWLQLFIPEFEDVLVESSELSSKDTLIVKEKYSAKYFTKDLLSDGTYNILAILTAVFQSDEPQFLCIEEPENGLTPDVIKEMVTLFRNACEEKGHYIWLNTHSQSLVSQLTSDEIITVNKIKGETKIKQFKGKDFHGLRMDEAWLTNTLGGGLPW